MNNKHIALCPGSFDPVTLGHADIVRRASEIFDKVYVAVMSNSEKTPLFSTEERLDMCRRVFADCKNVEVVTGDGLTTSLASSLGAATLVKGVRDEKDFSYEMLIAAINKRLDADIDTIFIPAKEAHVYVSSSTVRELAKYGADISSFVPACIIKDVEAKFRK